MKLISGPSNWGKTRVVSLISTEDLEAWIFGNSVSPIAKMDAFNFEILNPFAANNRIVSRKFFKNHCFLDVSNYDELISSIEGCSITLADFMNLQNSGTYFSVKDGVIATMDYFVDPDYELIDLGTARFYNPENGNDFLFTYLIHANEGEGQRQDYIEIISAGVTTRILTNGISFECMPSLIYEGFLKFPTKFMNGSHVPEAVVTNEKFVGDVKKVLEFIYDAKSNIQKTFYNEAWDSLSEGEKNQDGSVQKCAKRAITAYNELCEDPINKVKFLSNKTLKAMFAGAYDDFVDAVEEAEEQQSAVNAVLQSKKTEKIRSTPSSDHFVFMLNTMHGVVEATYNRDPLEFIFTVVNTPYCVDSAVPLAFQSKGVAVTGGISALALLTASCTLTRNCYVTFPERSFLGSSEAWEPLVAGVSNSSNSSKVKFPFCFTDRIDGRRIYHVLIDCLIDDHVYLVRPNFQEDEIYIKMLDADNYYSHVIGVIRKWDHKKGLEKTADPMTGKEVEAFNRDYFMRLIPEELLEIPEDNESYES